MQNWEAAGEWQATGTDGAPALRDLATERLAAHRQRRAAVRAEQRAADAEQQVRQGRSRSASRAVQESVARRYQNSVSYHEFLAVEAERAIAQAQAEAEVAARTAAAVAEAQMKLLGELEQWRETEPSPREAVLAEVTAERRQDLADAMADIAQAATELLAAPATRIELVSAPLLEPSPKLAPAPLAAEMQSAGVTVRLYEELAAATSPIAVGPQRESAAEFTLSIDAAEVAALEDEIDFRREPQFIDFHLEPVPIPGNVIEFPKPIVASHKARPRRAEGPLLENLVPSEPQLRIFEVEAERLVSTSHEAVVDTEPEWQRMVLPAQATPELQIPLDAQVHFTHQPQTASVGLRLMSAAVDGSLVGAAWLAVLATAAELAGPRLRLVPVPALAATGAVMLGALALGYLLLFFTFSNATPGMRYAHIALCTFGERYPTRRALRRRLVATLLAVSPLGMGLLWALMDDEKLGWHDRISRMYQRAY